MVEFRDDNDSVVFSKQLPKNERLIVDNLNLPIGLYKLYENGKSIEKFILFSNLPVRKPIGVIDISFSGAIKNEVIGRIEGFEFPFFNYQVHFNARNTFWRYLLISKYSTSLKNTMIDSGTENLKFSGPKEVKLKNGADAISFVSEVPLSLKQVYEWKFQLKMLGSGFTGAKTIMDRLPLASPEIIKSEPGSDELKFFSEIIVYI